MPTNFYDKAAKRFGGYGYGNSIKIHYKSEYPNGEPEKIFKEKLLELSSKNKIALDVGCADGKFTLSIAPYFQKVYGIDTSKKNLDVAKIHNKDKRNKNVEYSFQNAKHTSFKDSFFDIVYCRRGPTYYKEYHRILKINGVYLEIGIGETDTIELKKTFDRGQNFGKWNTSILQKDTQELKNLGFDIIYEKDFHYFEYYRSYKDLDIFLQGVPIFEDFGSEDDRSKLEQYVNKFFTVKGIKLSRHRIVLVGRKH
ncbi:MAG: class I SAM-dependent methyltransferase [bacterium]